MIHSLLSSYSSETLKEVNPGVKSPLCHQLLKEKLKGKVKPNKYILYEELIPLPIKADKRSAL